MSEDMWSERAQSAEGLLVTMKESLALAVGRVKEFKGNFGIRERQDGEIVIDYDKFVDRLGLKEALVLRNIIDERYGITGEPGKKPHLKIVATSD